MNTGTPTGGMRQRHAQNEEILSQSGLNDE